MSNQGVDLFDGEWDEIKVENQIYREFFVLSVRDFLTCDVPPVTLFRATYRLKCRQYAEKEFIALTADVALAEARRCVDDWLAVPSVLTTLRQRFAKNKI